MTNKKFNVTQVKLPPRPRSERRRAGGGVSGGSTVIIGGSQSGGGVPDPHASTHSKGGSDPLRPHDIGAATAEHLHDDKYHPLGGSSELDFEAGNLRVAESAEVGRELIVGEAVTSPVLRSPNHDGLDRRGYVVEEIGDTGQYAIRIHSAEIFGELTVNVLTVSEQRAVIGAVVNTCAGCEISMVEELSDRYRCYYQSKFGQWWMVGDQPECKRVISGGEVSNYYWRLVVAVGSEQIEDEPYYWFDMSKSVAVGSGVPAKGDQVANCGHRGADARRKNYIITSAWGESPYTAIYKGIDDFSLDGKRVKYESVELVEIASDVFRLTSPDGRTATPPVQVRADGDWSAARVPYFYYQQVMHRGFAWLCIDKSSTGTGVEPSPSAHNSWICTSKDYDGELADVRAVLDGVAAESSANAQRLVAMSSDGVLSREEKVAARSLWQQIELSYTRLVGLATTNSVNYAALTAARNALEGLFITVQLNSDTDWVYPAMGQAGSKMDYDTKLSNWDFEIAKLSRDISKSHVDAIEIGGVNYVRNSDFATTEMFWTKPDWATLSISTTGGKTKGYMFGGAGGGQTIYSQTLPAKNVCSFWYKGQIYVVDRLNPSPLQLNAANWTYHVSYDFSYFLFDVGYVCDIKVEKGDKPTAWSPSIEDTKQQIADALAAANKAQADAEIQGDRLTSWASDTVISPTEKMSLKDQHNAAIQEKISIDADVLKYKLTASTAYTQYVSAASAAFAAWDKYTRSIPESITIDSDYGNIAAYYKFRSTILTVISDKISKDYTNSVQIGGVNLMLNSKVNIATNQQLIAYPILSREFNDGETITVTIEGELYGQGYIVGLYPSSFELGYMKYISETKATTTFTFNKNSSYPADSRDRLIIYRYPDTARWINIKTIMVEIGNKATDWSPASEDVKEDIQQGDNALSKIFGGGASPQSLLDFLGDNLDEKSFSVQKIIKHPTTGVSTPIMAVNNLAAYNLAVDNAFLNYLEAQKINVTKGGEDRIQIRAGSGSGDGISMFVGNVLKMSFTPALIPPLSALLNPIGGTSVIVNLNASASASWDQRVTDSKESSSIHIDDNLTYIVTTPPIGYTVSASNPRGFASASVSAYLRNNTTGYHIALLGSASSPFDGRYSGVIPGRTFTIAQSGEYVIYVEVTATAQDTEAPENPEVRASSDAFIYNEAFSILRTNTVSYQYSNGLFLIYDSANYDYTNVGGVSEYRRGNYIERLDSEGRRKSTNAGMNWVNM